MCRHVGGSKGIPGKNIRNLGKHPLLAYSIASALASSTVTRLIVSTDDAEIAEVAQRYGAEVPFTRPAELATDAAQDYPLFEHALAWLKANEGLYRTSSCSAASDIAAASERSD